MQQYRNNVQDQFGNVIANVTVTINERPGGGLASIFSDDGVTPKSNPFTNDTDGEFNFYADNARYDIELTGPLTESIPDIRLLDLAAVGSSIRINTDIATATPPTTEAVTGNYEIYDFDNDDQLASFGFNGSNELHSVNYMEAGLTVLRATQAGGGIVNTFLGSPDGAAVLYNAGVIRADAHSTGRFRVYSDGNTDAEQRTVNFCHADATVRGQVGFLANDILILANLINGGATQVRSNNAGGLGRTFLDGDPDGLLTLNAPTNFRANVNITEAAIIANANAGVDLYYDAAKTFGQEAPGECVIFGDANADIDFRVLYGAYADGTHKWALGQENGSDFAMRNEINGGIVHLSAFDSGGVARFFIQGDPDGITDLRGDTDVQILVNVGNEIAVECVANGKVGLRFNSLEKLRTQDHSIAGNVSGAEVIDGLGVFQPVGFNVLGNILQNANYTFLRDRCGYDIYKNAAGAVIYTVPASASASQTDIPVGAVYEVTNEDTEALTIDGTETGITLRWCPTGGTGDRTLAQWGIARLKKRSDSLWFITGVGLT